MLELTTFSFLQYLNPEDFLGPSDQKYLIQFFLLHSQCGLTVISSQQEKEPVLFYQVIRL